MEYCILQGHPDEVIASLFPSTFYKHFLERLLSDRINKLRQTHANSGFEQYLCRLPCDETCLGFGAGRFCSAVLSSPAYGYYFVNEDSSIWASAWWWGKEEYPLHAGKGGNKVAWFRPEGTVMEITGRRLDGQAPPLETDIPCCYPTRFQASGLYFPTAGCWEVTAKAADSVLSFVAKVKP